MIRVAVLLVVGAVGCSSSSYRLEVRFESAGLFEQARAVEVYLLDSCSGLEDTATPPASFRRHVVARPGQPSAALGEIDPGAVALYALGRDQNCGVVAAGCAEFDVVADGSGTLGVAVAPKTGQGCTAEATCSDGECREPGHDGGVDAGSCGLEPVEDYCTEIPTLPQEPLLDGHLDCKLELRPMPRAAYAGAEGASEPTDTNNFSYAVAYHPNGLYVYFDVETRRTTPAATLVEPFCGASVEVHADADGVFATPGLHDLPGTRQITISAPGKAELQARVYWEDADQQTQYTVFSQFRTRKTEQGYAVEAFVRPTDLGLPGQTMGPDRVGFALSINLSVLEGEAVWLSGCVLGQRPLGVRYGQYVSAVGDPPRASCKGGFPHCDTGAFCTPSVVP